MQSNSTITILVPVYNEAGNVVPVYQNICSALSDINMDFDVIFIDDGSNDGTFQELQELHDSHNNITVIRFRRNCGKSAALAQGIKKATGDYIITMDGDGQDEPQEIPAMIALLESGYDVVTGWKFPRMDPITKTLPSRIYNHVTGRLTGLKLHDMNCGLKLFRREVFDSIELYGELHRFVLVLAKWHGFRVTEKKVKHHPRLHGKSKFGLYRYLAGFFDLLTVLFLSKFIVRPMHLFGGLGGLLLGVGGLVNFYLAVGWLFGKWIGGRPLLFLGILLIITGLQLISTGLLAEMFTKFAEKKALYPVEKVLEKNT